MHSCMPGSCMQPLVGHLIRSKECSEKGCESKLPKNALSSFFYRSKQQGGLGVKSMQEDSMDITNVN